MGVTVGSASPPRAGSSVRTSASSPEITRPWLTTSATPVAIGSSTIASKVIVTGSSPAASSPTVTRTGAADSTTPRLAATDSGSTVACSGISSAKPTPVAAVLPVFLTVTV